MLKPWTRYLLFVGTLPTDLVGWLFAATVRLFWGTALRWEDGVLRVTMREGSWPVRTWYARWGGTTIGHAVVMRESAPYSTYLHELVHVEQCQAAGILGVFLALGALVGGVWWLAIAWWCLTPALVYAVSGLAALARGEDFYRGNVQEEGARHD